MQEVEKLELARRQHQAGASYIIVPVTHVETSVPTAFYTSSQRSNSSVTTTSNMMGSSNYSPLYVPATRETGGGVPSGNGPPVYSVVHRSHSQPNNPISYNSVAVGSTSSTGSSPSPQTSFPPTTSPPPPPSTSSSEQGPYYASVTHTRNTVTRATSHPVSASRGNSHSTNNNQTGSRNASVTGNYEEVAGQVKPKRGQSSKDKGCKQQ